MNTVFFSALGIFCGWVLIFVLQSIAIRRSSMSQYEIRRRIANGDGSALQAQRRELAYPRLVLLKQLSILFLLIILVICAVSLWSIWLGLAVTLSAFFVVMTLPRLSAIRLLSQKFYLNYEDSLISFVERSKWLDIFYASDTTSRQVIQSREELIDIVHTSHVLTDYEKRLCEFSLQFKDRSIKDVMTPAKNISVIDSDESLGPLVLDSLHKTGHNYFPVILGDIHHVVGMLNINDVIDLKTHQSLVSSAMDPRVHYVEESASLRDALKSFMADDYTVAIVRDEHKQTVGIVTLKDIIGIFA